MSVVLGLPKKLLPSPEASLSEGCSSQWVKIQPNNVASVVSNSYSGMTASTLANQIPFPSQEVRFSIPTGQGKNVWLDTSKTTLSFRARYQVSAVSVGSATITSNLMSNGLAFWDRVQLLNSNGQAVEDVTGLALAEHHKQVFSFNSSERDSLALSFGYKFENEDADSRNILQGHSIPAFSTTTTLATGSNYFSYEIPFPSSLIGAGAKGFLPVGALQKLDCYLTTNSIMPVILDVGSGLSTSATIIVTLDNFSINASYLTLDDKSSALLGSPKIHYLHGITNRTSNATLNSGVQGQVSTLIGIRGQSVRSLATRFSESVYTTAGSANGVFDSKLPLCSQLNYFLQGSTRVPPNPLSTNQAPASVFSHAIQASGAFTERDMKFGGIPDSFATYWATGTAPTSANGYDQYIINAGSATLSSSLCNFVFAEDLRKASTSAILDGMNLSMSANNYLEMNITNAPTNTIYVSFISSQDVIYLIDMEQGTIDYRL